RWCNTRSCCGSSANWAYVRPSSSENSTSYAPERSSTTVPTCPRNRVGRRGLTQTKEPPAFPGRFSRRSSTLQEPRVLLLNCPVDGEAYVTNLTPQFHIRTATHSTESPKSAPYCERGGHQGLGTPRDSQESYAHTSP